MKTQNIQVLGSCKDSIIKALKSLPPSVNIPVDNQPSDLSTIHLYEEVSQDIVNLNDYWNFIEDYQNQSVIAMIGMVNAGKSALGNHLLHREESGIFVEGPIRETAQASQAQLDKNTLLIDLPGLGSVLSQEDDRVVKDIIRRANLLLIVIGVNQPISKHLYDFIQSEEIIKAWDSQRVIFILNKLDILDGFPEVHRNKQIESCEKFLTDGDSKMGFPGINRLFDYEILIIPFSVIHARQGKEMWRDKALRTAIQIALENSSNGCIFRSRQRLIDYCKKYLFLAIGYIEMQGKILELGELVELSSKSMLDDMGQIISGEIKNLISTVINIREDCSYAMQKCQPDGIESFFKGDAYQSKKTELRNCRDRYKSQLCSVFDSFADRLRDALVIIIKGTFGTSSYVYLPDKDKVHETLQDIIYNIWDVFDDVYFYGYSTDSSQIRAKLGKESSRLESAGTAIDTWKAQLIDRVLEAIKQSSQQGNFAKLSEYISAASELEDFFKIITSTETFQQIVSE